MNRNLIANNDRLKRSKSEDKDEEYDYIIEEYTESYNKSKRSAPKDKPKLDKTKSSAQPKEINKNRLTTDQKFSYKDSDHEIWNEYDMIISEETEYYVRKKSKKTLVLKHPEKVLDTISNNRAYGHALKHQ